MTQQITFNPGEWFLETPFSGTRRCKRDIFNIKKEIYKGKTRFQDIFIFETNGFGRVLTLDGIIQLSESDEFIYHEMIVHVPLLSHPKPERMLIIGGGDGGTLREAARHPLKEIVMVDLDKEVVDLSKKYLPFVSRGCFKDKRLKLCFEDGLKFIDQYTDYFDIIIVDCTDPVGPGKVLFETGFYKKVFNALQKDGVASFQISPFLDFDYVIKGTAKKLRKFFSSVKPIRLPMPSYSCGSEYCFLVASKTVELGKASPAAVEKRLNQRLKGQAKKLKYYSPAIHQACFVMPRIWQL